MTINKCIDKECFYNSKSGKQVVNRGETCRTCSKNTEYTDNKIVVPKG